MRQRYSHGKHPQRPHGFVEWSEASPSGDVVVEMCCTDVINGQWNLTVNGVVRPRAYDVLFRPPSPAASGGRTLFWERASNGETALVEGDRVLAVGPRFLALQDLPDGRITYGVLRSASLEVYVEDSMVASGALPAWAGDVFHWWLSPDHSRLAFWAEHRNGPKEDASRVVLDGEVVWHDDFRGDKPRWRPPWDEPPPLRT